MLRLNCFWIQGSSIARLNSFVPTRRIASTCTDSGGGGRVGAKIQSSNSASFAELARQTAKPDLAYEQALMWAGIGLLSSGLQLVASGIGNETTAIWLLKVRKACIRM